VANDEADRTDLAEKRSNERSFATAERSRYTNQLSLQIFKQSKKIEKVALDARRVLCASAAMV